MIYKVTWGELMRGLYCAITIGLLFFMMLVAGHAAFGAQTSTTTEGLIGADDAGRGGYARFTTWSATASAANEDACLDVRAYDYCDYKYVITGTINVDFDWSPTSTYDATYFESEADDVTASGYGNMPIEGGYFCYDVDSCTTCTLTLTVNCYTDNVR